jgi:hypothetical protein
MIEKFTAFAIAEGHFTKDEIEAIQEKTTDRFFEDKISKEQQHLKTLENQFTTYKQSLQDELKGNVSEEKIMERLKHENNYYQTKDDLVKTGIISKEQVALLEGKVSTSLQKKQDEKHVTATKNITQELER